jgi:hypothetical protein
MIYPHREMMIVVANVVSVVRVLPSTIIDSMAMMNVKIHQLVLPLTSAALISTIAIRTDRLSLSTPATHHTTSGRPFQSIPQNVMAVANTTTGSYRDASAATSSTANRA